jgi:hypothetical protein
VVLDRKRLVSVEPTKGEGVREDTTYQHHGSASYREDRIGLVEGRQPEGHSDRSVKLNCRRPVALTQGTQASPRPRAVSLILDALVLPRPTRHRGIKLAARYEAILTIAASNDWLQASPNTAGGGVHWLAQSSAHRFLHQRAGPCLVGGGQLGQREGGGPHGAFVEVRLGPTETGPRS